jgi:S1/P1 Nuclease
MKAISSLIVCAALLASPTRCFAWGEVGHRIVARIAASQLTPAARANVARILGVQNTPAAVANALGDAAEWPDAVARAKYTQTVVWHFIDLGVKPNAAKDGLLWANPDTAFARIVKFFGTIKARARDELERASDLKFLVHLVGDIHQPLHDATDQDRGGNCVGIVFVTRTGATSQPTELHATWDRGILEDRLGTNNAAIAQQLMQARAAQLPALLKTAADTMKANPTQAVRSWVSESHAIAVTQIYAALDPAVPSFETRPVSGDCHDAAPVFKGKTWKLKTPVVAADLGIIDDRLLLAGIRLAAMINALV